jgi:hypothetical protein
VTDASIYRFGGWAATVGGVLGVTSLFLHTGPRRGNTTKFLSDIADNELWAIDHLGILLAVLLLMAPLAALTRSFTDGAASQLAAFGWTTAVIGASVTLVYATIDGPAMKAVAEAWAGADASDQPSLLAAAEAIRHVDIAGFALWTLLLTGITPVLYGAAVMVSSDHTTWIGGIAVAAGVVGIVQALITFFAGLVRFVVFGLAPAAVLTTVLWITWMGLLLWRRNRVGGDHAAIVTTTNNA